MVHWVCVNKISSWFQNFTASSHTIHTPLYTLYGELFLLWINITHTMTHYGKKDHNCVVLSTNMFFFQLWNLKLDPICSRLRPLYLPIVRHKVLGALLITQKFPMTLKGIKPREKAMYSGQLEMARLLVFPQYTFIT